jgi:hypothetical protein
MRERVPVAHPLEAQMKQFPQITAKQVIELTGSPFLSDALWAVQFGQEIEYRCRPVPYQLIYLLHKYECTAIPHGFFVESIRDVCGSTRPVPNSSEFERVKLSEDAACRLIDEVVALGLIMVVQPPGDRRYRLYFVSEEQIQKLYNIREGEADIYRITTTQGNDPDNPAAGRNETNSAWCENIYTSLVKRRDDKYYEYKSMLEKIKHLMAVLAPFVVGALFAAMTFAEAFATIRSGGA